MAKSVIQEERFEYKGLPCVVLFLSPGYRCGYAGLPKGTVINTDDINCHGGITYSAFDLRFQDDTDRYWIGFDCCHCFDDYDIEKAKEVFADDEFTMGLIEHYIKMKCCVGGNFRTLDYVKDECKKIVDQYLEMRDE